MCSRTPLIRIANYPDRIVPLDKFVDNSTKVTSVEITGCRINELQNFKLGAVERFRRRYRLYIVTASVVYFQRKIQLSGFSAYPDGLPSQLVRISVVFLYCHT